MRAKTFQPLWAATLERARKQHGAISRQQLLALGWSDKGIKWALAVGKLHHAEWRGVYVVGRPELSRHGRVRAALLTGGNDATLTGGSAGDLWRIWKPRDGLIHISLPAVQKRRQRRGIAIHRRTFGPRDVTHHWGIRVTSPLRTVIDLAATCDAAAAERLVNAADARNVIRADVLHRRLGEQAGQPGVPLLTGILDRHTFVLTESEIERLFPPLARRAGLGTPESQRRLGRGRVDFWFPRFNLVVECDSLRYHRTPLQQAEDAARDHAHLLAGRRWARVTSYQLKYDPEYVVAFLAEARHAWPPKPAPARA
jgi:very-short-patch-repair endonuclease